MSPINIAIVGVGYWGPKLVKIFQSIPSVSVAALCDLNQELLSRVGQECGLAERCTSDFDLLLQSDERPQKVDAVVLATPPGIHYELAKKALRAGKHVFVEKPLATRYAEAKELAEISREKRLTLFVDHTFCYDEVFGEIRKKIRAGDLGAISYARFSWLGARQKEHGPDVLWDSGPHAFAAFQFLIGKRPLRVSMKKFASLSSGVPSALAGRIFFEGDESGDEPFADILLAWKDQEIDGYSVPKSAEVIIQGAREAIRYEGSFEKRAAASWAGAHAVEISGSPFAPAAFNGEAVPFIGISYADEPLKSACYAFIESITNTKSPPTDGIFGGDVVRAIEAAARSLAKNGQDEIF